MAPEGLHVENSIAKKPRTDKLIDATGIERNSKGTGYIQNEKVFEITKDIESELSELPEFIGVFPFGSRVSGYSVEASEEKRGSDYDINILIDGQYLYGSSLPDELLRIKRKYKEQGIEVNFKPWYFDKDDFIDEISFLSEMPRNEEKAFKIASIGVLASPGRGKKIEVWRESLREELMKLPESQQNVYFDEIMSVLMNRERFSVGKLENRISDLNRAQYLEVRKKLWSNRVGKIYFGRQEK